MSQDESSTSRPPLLPATLVVEIFRELQGSYGSRFLNQWKTGQINEKGRDLGTRNAMNVWARKLAGFAEYPDAIRAVLESLPDDPPSLPEFIALCRSAASRSYDSVPRLEHRMTPEERERADRAVAKAIDKALDRNRNDPLAWAKHPRSQEALDLMIDGAKSHVGLRKVLADLVEGGIAGEGDVLLRRYLGPWGVCSGKR